MPKLKISLRSIKIFIVFLGFYLFRLFSIPSLNIPDQSEIKLTGRITQQPYLKGSKQIIFIDSFMVVTDCFPSFFYGQRLEVVGKVSQRLTSGFQRQYSLNYPAIRELPQEAGLINQISFQRLLFAWRKKGEEQISRFLAEPQASLLVGILFGAKKEMPASFLASLRETGTLHLVVASGYNIAVLAGFLIESLVLIFPRKQAIIFSFLGILFYIFLAGAEPPLVRAGIMAVMGFGAQLLGREKESGRALFLAAFLMLLFNPLLLFDIGFQLSFASTAGILFLSRFFRFLKLPLIGADLQTTLAAQAASSPILFFHFGEFNFLSPLINILVLPLVPLIMFLGVLVVFSGLIWSKAGIVAGWLAWLPLTYFVKIITWAAGF